MQRYSIGALIVLLLIALGTATSPGDEEEWQMQRRFLLPSAGSPRTINATHVDMMMQSAAFKKAHQRFRAERVARGLSPDLVPHEVKLRMRDGVELYTLYWDPRLFGGQAPTVLIRSPYGPLGTQNMALLYTVFGFVAVGQDQRGTGLSGGDYCFWQASTNDGTDTLKWITLQEWSNGQVFQIGASADGIVTLMDMKQPQPALFGQYLMITSATPYGTLFQNNQALRYALSKDWLDLMQLWRPTVPAGTYFDIALHNEGYASHWTPTQFQCDNVTTFSWTRITLNDTDYKNVNFPAIWYGGWYDIFIGPQIQAFKKYDTLTSGKAVGNQQIIIDALGHCGLERSIVFTDDSFGAEWGYQYSVDMFKAAVHKKHAIHMPPSPREMGMSKPLKKWTVYVMGPMSESGPRTGMYWTTFDVWPTATPTTWYLGANSVLSPNVPAQSIASFVYNPADPTPTNGGQNLFLKCGPQNQTDNDNRGDNLIFDTAPFSSDTAILGSIIVNLNVMTNRTDTDFVVRVSDLYPDGVTSILLTDNVVRMRWRNGDLEHTPTVPFKWYNINVTMWETAYVFNVGHSLRIAVTSSNYPRYSANLNNGNDVLGAGPSLVAQNSVSLGNPLSNVILPIVPLSAIPNLE